MPLGAVPVLSWCGEVSLGGKQSASQGDYLRGKGLRVRVHPAEPSDPPVVLRDLVLRLIFALG